MTSPVSSNSLITAVMTVIERVAGHVICSLIVNTIMNVLKQEQVDVVLTSNPSHFCWGRTHVVRWFAFRHNRYCWEGTERAASELTSPNRPQ